MGTALSFSGSVFKVYVYRPAAFLVLLLGEFERQDTVAEFARWRLYQHSVRSKLRQHEPYERSL